VVSDRGPSRDPGKAKTIPAPARSFAMSMAVGGKKGGAIADINVTPMADIMIVLLIIFMVITPMLQKGVDVKLPSAANTKERKDEPKSITVAVKRDTTTYLGGTKLDKQEDLVPQLKEKLEDMPEGGKMIYLKADQELPYSEVMKVMDLAREAGVEEIPVITVNKSPVANMEELDQRLKDIFQTRSDKTMFVRAAGKIPYGRVVEAMDVAKGAGVERIGIISEKMIEQAGGVAEGGTP